MRWGLGFFAGLHSCAMGTGQLLPWHLVLSPTVTLVLPSDGKQDASSPCHGQAGTEALFPSQSRE